MDALVHFFISLITILGFVVHPSQALQTLPLPQIVPPPRADIVFVGDMLFDRSIRTVIEQHGGDYVFSCMDPILSQADLVVGNLEGPITDNPSVSQDSEPGDGNNYTFTFPPSTAALLYAHNVRLVSLGNNHIMNFSLDGLMQTERYLDAAGVGHFGDPDKPEAERVAHVTVNGVSFAFVNWSDWTSDKTDHTVAQVREEAGAGRVVVVYSHWGEEYATTSPERVQRLARQFVDAGASLVVGSHPHVVQQHEIYHGKDIYYSLGNFIFDQYWIDEVDHGLVLDVAFGPNGVERINEIPVVLQRDRRTCPDSASSAPHASAL